MDPGELDELIKHEPFVPLRLTLSSGDVVELLRSEGIRIAGVTMTIVDSTITGHPRVRLISVPNIALVEPFLGGDATTERLR